MPPTADSTDILIRSGDRWAKTLSLPVLRIVSILMAVLALAGFGLIAEQVWQLKTLPLDRAILLALRSRHSPLLDQIMWGITFLGEPKVLLVLCSGVGIGLWQVRQRREAGMLAIATFGAIGLNYVLKHLFSRPRPHLWERLVKVDTYSFPSGHAMLSIAFYCVLGYLLTNYFPRWRVLTISLTVMLIAAIGFSRLYLGVHWPSDVVAGYAVSFVWLVACILMLEGWQHYRSSQEVGDDGKS